MVTNNEEREYIQNKWINKYSKSIIKDILINIVKKKKKKFSINSNF